MPKSRKKKIKGLLEPPKIKKVSGNGRPAIDYAALYELWRNSDHYVEIKDFLSIYGIDYTSRTAKEKTRDWLRKEAQLRIETVERTTWEKVVEWRSHQFEEDYRVSTKIRRLVEERAEQFETMNKSGKQVRTIDLLNLAKAAETIQRVQRLSLGLSTDNVGVDDVQAKKDLTEVEEVFVVEMNENGKFKTQRPRKITV